MHADIGFVTRNFNVVDTVAYVISTSRLKLHHFVHANIVWVGNIDNI